MHVQHAVLRAVTSPGRTKYANPKRELSRWKTSYISPNSLDYRAHKDTSASDNPPVFFIPRSSAGTALLARAERITAVRPACACVFPEGQPPGRRTAGMYNTENRVIREELTRAARDFRSRLSALSLSFSYAVCLGRATDSSIARRAAGEWELTPASHPTLYPEFVSLNFSRSSRLFRYCPKEDAGTLCVTLLCRRARARLWGGGSPGSLDEVWGCCAPWTILFGGEISDFRRLRYCGK